MKLHYRDQILQEFAKENLPEASLAIKFCGLVIDEKNPQLCALPDALLGDHGILEIVCFAKFSLLTITQACEKKNSELNAILLKKDQSKLNERHNLFYDIQGKLHITGRSFCMVIIWTKIDKKTIKVERNDQFWMLKIDRQVSNYYVNHLIPEIVDSRFLRSRPIRGDNVVDDQSVKEDCMQKCGHKFKNLRFSNEKKRKSVAQSDFFNSQKKARLGENITDAELIEILASDSTFDSSSPHNRSSSEDITEVLSADAATSNFLQDSLLENLSERNTNQILELHDLNRGKDENINHLSLWESLYDIWPFLRSESYKNVDVSSVENLAYFMHLDASENDNFHNFARTSLSRVSHLFANLNKNFILLLHSFLRLKDRCWIDGHLMDFFMIIKKILTDDGKILTSTSQT